MRHDQEAAVAAVTAADGARSALLADLTPGGHDIGHSVLLVRRHRYARHAVELQLP